MLISLAIAIGPTEARAFDDDEGPLAARSMPQARASDASETVRAANGDDFDEGPGGPRLSQIFDSGPGRPRFQPASPARHSSAPQVTASAPTTTGDWYGWQMLLASGASCAVIASGAASDSEEVMIAGVVTLTAGSPIIHFAHGNWREGLGSTALHVGVPALTGLAGAAIACAEPGRCDGPFGVIPAVSGALLGALIGKAGALGADVAFLSWHRREDTDPSFALAPTASVDASGRASFGVAGSF